MYALSHCTDSNTKALMLFIYYVSCMCQLCILPSWWVHSTDSPTATVSTDSPTATASTEIPTDPAVAQIGLSPGAIAGIIIVLLLIAVLVGAVVIVVFLWWKKRSGEGNMDTCVYLLPSSQNSRLVFVLMFSFVNFFAFMP